MITYAELNQIITEGTQDSFSDRYRPSVRIGAINSAVRRATTALGWAMANKKGPEEALRELKYIRIFQTNSQGGIDLSDPALGHPVWNVLAIYARPYTVEEQTILPLDPSTSQYRADLSWSGSESPVERVTDEEVPLIRKNFLRNGNEIMASNPKRVTFAYYIPGNASSAAYQSPLGSELRVLPQSVTGQQLIAMNYVAQPTEFVTPSGSVAFPQAFKQTLGEWALYYIAIPQGDTQTLMQSSEKDAMQLFANIA